MRYCMACGREYLDSYESCPFCTRLPGDPSAREFEEAHARAASAVLVRRVILVSIVLVLGVLGYTLVYPLLLAPAVSGAHQQVGRVECFNMQSRVEHAAMMREIETLESATSVSDLYPGFLEEEPVCPSGGTYTLEHADEDYHLVCSQHGHRFGEDRRAEYPSGLVEPSPDE